jgi:Skp family chaperone for outer membrane proteins
VSVYFQKKLLRTRCIQKHMKYGFLPVLAAAAVLSVPAAFGLFGGATPRPAAAQTTGADLRALVGSADSQKLLSEYKGRQAAEREAFDYANRLNQIAGRLQNGGAIFLPETETRDLAGLLEKAQPTADDTKRVGALETKAQNLSAEMAQLQNTISPNDAQKARLAELTEARRKGTEVLGKLTATYRSQIDDRRDKVGQKIVDEVRQAIVKVAKAKNLALVSGRFRRFVCGQ